MRRSSLSRLWVWDTSLCTRVLALGRAQPWAELSNPKPLLGMSPGISRRSEEGSRAVHEEQRVAHAAVSYCPPLLLGFCPQRCEVRDPGVKVAV